MARYKSNNNIGGKTHSNNEKKNLLYYISYIFRTFVTGGQVARCPSKSRLVEAIILRLTGEAVEQRAKGPEIFHIPTCDKKELTGHYRHLSQDTPGCRIS